jgi:hypothetical protein
MELSWIFEPPLHAADEEGKIYESVIGKHEGYYVAIYHGAEVNADLTAAEGRQRYWNVPMMVVRNKGESDYTSVPLTRELEARFPRAARWWKEKQSDAKRVSIALLPGITPADLAELRELNIADVETLAKLNEIPKNLEPFRDLARRFVTISKPRLRIVDGVMEQVA